MKGETADEAILRAAGVAIDAIRIATNTLEPGTALAPAHDLLTNTCVKLANEWVVFRRLDHRGHLVVAKPGSACEWTYEPTRGEVFLTAMPF